VYAGHRKKGKHEGDASEEGCASGGIGLGASKSKLFYIKADLGALSFGRPADCGGIGGLKRDKMEKFSGRSSLQKKVRRRKE